VAEVDKELSQLAARLAQLQTEKKTAQFNKTLGNTSVEELERYLRELRMEKKKAEEAAARADLHSSFAEQPDEKVRAFLKDVVQWANKDLCALEEFKYDIEDKRKKSGIWGARSLVPYGEDDVMPYTRGELESRLAEFTQHSTQFIIAASELSRVMRIPPDDALKSAVQRAANVAVQEVNTKKRKLTHARRGCECNPDKGCKMGGPGRDCKCVTGGIACDQRCDCGGKCANPKNAAETEEETNEREAWTAGSLIHKEQEIKKLSDLAARAAAAAAAMEIDTPPKRG
jgi:hypothetical protein